MPIAYFPRGGATKNRTVRDGIGNLSHLISARLGGRRDSVPGLVAAPPFAALPAVAEAPSVSSAA